MNHATRITGLFAMGVGALAHAAAGDLDTSFSSDGLATVPFDLGGSRGDYAHASAVQPDGRIVVVGTASDADGVHMDFAITRLNANGTKDTGFGANGLVHLHTNSSTYDTAEAVAIQADGKIVVAGTADKYAAILRLNANGTQDTTFAVAAPNQIYAIGSGQTNGAMKFHALALQADGKIIAVGEGTNVKPTGYSDDFFVMRFQTNGVPDPTFYGPEGPGYAGTVWVPFDLTGANRDAAYAVALQSDGKIVLAGEAQYGGNDYDFAIARLNTNGSLDTGFSGDGKTTVPFDRGGVKRDGATGVAITATGTIVVAGTVTSTPGYYNEIGVTRLLANGAIDATFGLSGRIDTIYVQTGGTATNPVSNIASGMTLGGDGTLWIAGSQDPYGTTPYSTCGFAHLSADGRTILGAGAVDFGNAASANGITRDAQGKLLLVGPRQFNETGDHDFAIARLLGQ